MLTSEQLFQKLEAALSRIAQLVEAVRDSEGRRALLEGMVCLRGIKKN